jgi:hypothetical protein
MSLRSVCFPLLGCALFGCAAPVETTSEPGGAMPPETSLSRSSSTEPEEVATTSEALVSGTLPDSIDLIDQQGGADERVFTPQGIMFSSATGNSAGGMGSVVNPTGFGVSVDISVFVTCKPSRGGANYSVSTVQHVTLKPGATTNINALCRSGDTPVQTESSFDHLYSDAPDTNFTDQCSTTYASITSDIANNGAPNGTLYLCSGLWFKNKKRATWGSAEFTNNGSSSVTVKFLYVHVLCSGGGGSIKSWGPSTVAPGQTMTATQGCPSGQTVTLVATSFTR